MTAERVSMNIIREEDAVNEVARVIPEEVLKAIEVLRKHACDPEMLKKLIVKRDTMEAQLEEAKKKVMELDEAFDEISDRVRQVEKHTKRMEELEEFIKGVD